MAENFLDKSINKVLKNTTSMFSTAKKKTRARLLPSSPDFSKNVLKKFKNPIKKKKLNFNTKLWNRKKWNKQKLNPMGDLDGDGVLNKFDCQPFNVMRQDKIYSIRPFKEKHSEKIIPSDLDKDFYYSKKKGKWIRSKRRAMFGRGTGWYGSGIYGFAEKKQAEDVINKQRPTGPYFGYIREFDIKKPLTSNHLIPDF